MPENELRIFVDAHSFDKGFQGARTFVKEIYLILARKKNIQLYIGAYDTAELQKYFTGNDPVIFIKYKNRSGIIRLLFDVPLIIKKYKIHYAHFQYIAPPVKNCRFIVTTHDVIFSEYPRQFSFAYRLLKKFLYKTSAAKADILTTVSAYSKKSIENHLGVNASRIHIIPNGINPVFFAPYDKQKVKAFPREIHGFENFILCVSRIEPRKNHALLLKAWLDLKLYLQGYHLVFIGYESTHTPAFHELLKSLPENIKQHIYMSSKINDADLLEFYRAANVFVYISIAEGFGIPPLEAAAVRIPVICSNSSAMSDFTFFGANHIDPLDLGLLKTRLLKTLTEECDPGSLEEIADLVRQKYSWDSSADQLYELIMNDKKK